MCTGELFALQNLTFGSHEREREREGELVSVLAGCC